MNKRHTLSSIDLLPEEAWPHVQSAIEELKGRHRTEQDIRNGLNEHLLALGCAPISRSAFNRHKLRLMAMGQRILQAREVAAVFAEKLKDEPGSDVGLLANEYLKSIVFEWIADVGMAEEQPSPKDMAALALTLMRLEAGRKMSVQQAVTRKNELVEKVDQAITEATKDKGLSAATVSKLRYELLGVVKKAADTAVKEQGST